MAGPGQLSTRPLVGALVALLTGGCLVSFDGYELGAADAGVGGTGGTAAAGGSAGAGASGGSTGGTGGSSAGGGGGGAGGSAGGGAGGSAGSGGGTGGSGGSAGGTGGAGGGTGGSGGAGGTGGGSGGSAGSGGSGGTTPSCPSVPGTAPMLQVPSGAGDYCIDQTEVTNAQYGAFVGAGGQKTQHSSCGSNTTFEPASLPNCNYDPIGKPELPVACVDWCDAWAYCNFFGKRLCGRIGAGTLAPAEGADAGKSEWFNACSAGGTRTYCYGSVYNVGTWDTCNGLEHNVSGSVPVNTLTSCQGGYIGIFHMSGNLREWEDACSSSGCNSRGGGFLDSGDPGGTETLQCASRDVVSRMTAAKDRGFRCCADLE